MGQADLELTLRLASGGTFTADLRFRAPDSTVDTELATSVPLALDPQQLLLLALDVTEYSRALTQMLFSAPEIREAWARVQGYVQGVNTPLRVRLRLDPTAEALHSIRWEVLQDFVSGISLCCSERTLFSRYLDTPDFTRVHVLPHSALRALIVISNPRDIETYQLAPLEVQSEMERIRKSLGQMRSRFLVSQPGQSVVSLRNLSAVLREGYPILYLVCHGTLVDQQPFLWLERDDSTSDPVVADELVRRIADLDAARRPLLVVLGSCRSAGDGHDDSFLAALGPKLARAGVAAVIGTQGDMPISTIERLMPRFFEFLLLEDGVVDRALALARAENADDAAWWRLVLFMRLRDGKLWFRPSEAPTSEPPEPSLKLLDVESIAHQLQSPRIRQEFNRFRVVFRGARLQIELLGTYKELHDTLQDLEPPFLTIDRNRQRLASDPVVWEELAEPAVDLQSIIQKVLALLQTPLIQSEATWPEQQLTASIQDLELAFEAMDLRKLEQGMARVRRVLTREKSRIDTHIVACVRDLQFQVLTEALQRIHDAIVTTSPGATGARHLASLSEDVRVIGQRLTTLVQEHHRWQEVDNEMRRVGESLSANVSELELIWPDLTLVLMPLVAERHEEWASDLTRLLKEIQALLDANDAVRARRLYANFRRKANRRFCDVDDEMLHMCRNLRQIGESLNLLMQIMDDGHDIR